MNDSIPHISKAQIKWVRSLQLKKVRDAEGVFVAEGDKCIGELLPAFELVLLVSNSASGLTSNSASGPTSYIATTAEIEQMSSLRTPQGSIAVFRKAPTSSGTATTSSEATSSGSATTSSEATSSGSATTSSEATSTLTLALDGIQDPGNLGTIIRTCDWFGIRDIYCSRETADCYNPKVVQATMGALARVRIHYVDLVDWLTSISASGLTAQRSNSASGLTTQGTPIYGTLLDGRNMYEPGAIASRDRGIIIMGNEGNGISPDVRPLITHPLYIPSFANSMNQEHTGISGTTTSATVESLNVSIATAIILAEFRRKQ